MGVSLTEWKDQCSNHSRELLMMGIVMSEKYWAYKKYNKIISGIYLVFFLQLSQWCTVTQISDCQSSLVQVHFIEVYRNFWVRCNISVTVLLILSGFCHFKFTWPLYQSRNLLNAWYYANYQLHQAMSVDFNSVGYWLCCWRIKDQLDVTFYFISLLMCSTCFGH